MGRRHVNRTLAAVCLLIAGGQNCALAQEDDEQAIQKFEASIKAGRYSQIREQLESYTAEHPQSWRALYQSGYVDFRLHRFQDSVSALSKSLIINGDFAEAHKIL